MHTHINITKFKECLLLRQNTTFKLNQNWNFYFHFEKSFFVNPPPQTEEEEDKSIQLFPEKIYFPMCGQESIYINVTTCFYFCAL